MINVRWRTNLDDVMRYEEFPNRMIYRPMVGDLVESLTNYRWGNDLQYDGRHLKLKICTITIIDEDTIEAELTIKGYGIGHDCISNFEKWYRDFRFGN